MTAVAYNNVAAALVRGDGGSGGGDRAAEPYYRQSLAILRRSVGDAHIDTARAYNSLASNLLRQDKTVEAEAAAASAVAILRSLNEQSAAGGNAVALSALDRQQVAPNRNIFTTYMNAAFGLMSDTPGAAQQSQIHDRAFRAAQDAISSASGRAVLQTAARDAAKTPQMADAVRQEQDLAAKANLIDKNLLRALSAQKPVEAARLRGELDGLQAQLADVSALIDKKYPSYRQLVSPRPIALADAQKALRPGEALLLMTEAANTFHLFVVTPTAVGWSRPGKDIDVILKQISDLRCDVDFATCSAARPGRTRRAADVGPGTGGQPALRPRHRQRAVQIADRTDRTAAQRHDTPLCHQLGKAGRPAARDVVGDRTAGRRRHRRSRHAAPCAGWPSASSSTPPALPTRPP